MLPAATLRLVDRLITAVMTLVHAVAPTGKPSRTPTTASLPPLAAESLTLRLANLLDYLIRISTFGIRKSPKAKPAARTPNPPAPAARRNPPSRPMPTFGLPRRKGWLLAALPDVAAPAAAEIGALLAHPPIAALLASAPALDRNLRPLLRALGLAIPTPPQPLPPSPRPPPSTRPATPQPQRRAPAIPTPAQPAARTIQKQPTQHVTL